MQNGEMFDPIFKKHPEALVFGTPHPPPTPTSVCRPRPAEVCLLIFKAQCLVLWRAIRHGALPLGGRTPQVRDAHKAPTPNETCACFHLTNTYDGVCKPACQAITDAVCRASVFPTSYAILYYIEILIDYTPEAVLLCALLVRETHYGQTAIARPGRRASTPRLETRPEVSILNPHGCHLRS